MSTNNQELVSTFLAFIDSARNDLSSRAPDSISYIHIKTLDIIERLGQPSMSDLAEGLNIASPGITVIVDKLVESKEIKRLDDPNDRRVTRLTITPKGKNDLKKGMEEMRTRIAKKFEILDQAEKTVLRALLEKLTNIKK